jgi:transposase
MGISIDLRTRAVSAYEGKEGTLETISHRFQIGTATLKRWLKRFREAGTVAEKPHGGGTPPKIPSSDLEKLAEVVSRKPDCTITEFREAWREESGVHASHATMVRALQRADLTLKKRRLERKNAILKNTRPGENTSNLSSQ